MTIRSENLGLPNHRVSCQLRIKRNSALAILVESVA